MKFFKIACLLFSMFFSFNAFAEETGISVTGPDILIDGACYSVAGGQAPYLWTTSEGSIDDSGCVSNVSGQCGTAAVTASDDCRATGSKAVTLHGGVGAISVSGPDAPQNGSCYAANNAVGTVQWGITKGSINSNGCVSNVSSQCGAATVTATDSCGETAVKNVRMPSGRWVYNVDNCYDNPAWFTQYHADPVITYNGILRFRAYRGCAYYTQPPSYNCGSSSHICAGSTYPFPFIWRRATDEWRCP